MSEDLEAKRRVFVQHFQAALYIIAAMFLDEILVGEQAFEILADEFAAEGGAQQEPVLSGEARNGRAATGLDDGERRTPGEWRPPIVKTVASRGEGVDELLEARDKHRGWLDETGTLHERRLHRAADEVETIAVTALRARVGDLRTREGEANLDVLAADVVAGRTDPYAAADRLLAGLTS